MNVNWFSTSFSNKMKKLSNASRTKETAPIMPLHFIKSEQEYYRNGTKTRTPNEQQKYNKYIANHATLIEAWERFNHPFLKNHKKNNKNNNKNNNNNNNNNKNNNNNTRKTKKAKKPKLH